MKKYKVEYAGVESASERNVQSGMTRKRLHVYLYGISFFCFVYCNTEKIEGRRGRGGGEGLDLFRLVIGTGWLVENEFRCTRVVETLPFDDFVIRLFRVIDLIGKG